jgi:two-component system, cell cycle sensor histidine kinase and response regulator CckA
MEVVGQFAGGVAHDFNNALAIIMGYGELVMQDLGPRHAMQKYLEEILYAAKRGAGLTQQLLIFSRKQTVQPVVLDLSAMEKMLRQLVDEKIELTMVCEKSIGQIMADSGYVWQLLMNLVVNARDAMPTGGKLAIETSSVRLNETYPKSHPGAIPGTRHQHPFFGFDGD